LSLEQVANNVGLPPEAAQKILNDFRHLLIADSVSPDFPSRMVAALNRPLPPNGTKLPTGEIVERITFEDVESLKFLGKGDPAMKKVMNQSYVRNLQDNNMYNSSNENDSYGRQVNNTYPNPFGQPNPGFAGNPAMVGMGGGGGQMQGSGQMSQMQQEEDDDALLMREILENNFNPRPHVVNRFIHMFKRFKHIWLAQPHKLLATLKANFQPSAGETAFMMFMDMRGQTIGSDNPQDLYRLTGASQYTPQSPGLAGMMASMGAGAGPATPDMAAAAGIGNGYGSQYAYGYGYPPNPVLSRREMMEIEEERAFNRKMDRMMKMQTMMSMNAMTRNSMSPQGGMMGDPNYPGMKELHEVVDPNTGRVTQRYYTSPAMNTTPQDQSSLKMLEIMGQQNTTLLSRLTQPDPIIGNITSKIFEASMDKADSMKQMSQMMEVMNNMRQAAGVGGPSDPALGAQSIKIAEMNNDMKLALAEMRLQHETRQHEWNLQAAEAQRAEENTQTFFKLAQEMGGRIIGPFVEKIAAGYAAKMGIGAAQEQANAQMAGAMPPQQQQVMMVDPQQLQMYNQMLSSGMDESGVRLTPSQIETLKAERRHMMTQIKNMQKQQQQLEEEMRRAQAQPPQQNVQQGNVPTSQAQTEIPSAQSQQQLITSASDEELDSVIRDAAAANAQRENIVAQILAEKARRAQGQTQTVQAQQEQEEEQPSGYASITANVFRQRTQTPVSQQDIMIAERQMYGVPERLQQKAPIPIQAVPPEDEEEEEDDGLPSNVAMPKNLGATIDEQTGSVAVVGAGGIKNQKPKTQEEEAAMMYGYAQPMSFNAPKTEDDNILANETKTSNLPAELDIKQDEEEENSSEEE